MPRYILPNGKAVYSEKEIPANELDNFLSSFMESQTPEQPTPQPTPTQQPNLPNAEPGFLSSIYHAVSDPLIDAPSRWARSASDWITNPSLATSETGQGGMSDYLANTWAKAKGFGAGALEGIGDLVSGLSSPSNIAMTALTAGQAPALRAGLPQIAKLMNIGAKASAVPGVIHGGSAVLNPESTLGERAMGLTELAGNVAGAAYKPKTAVIPEGPINPQAAALGEVPPPPMADLSQFSPEGMGKMNDLMNTPTAPINPADISVPPRDVRADIAAIRSREVLSQVDPNMNQGMGNPELAGSQPYGVAPIEPDFFNRIRPEEGRPLDPNNVQDRFAVDTARMEAEAAQRAKSYDPVREDVNRQWNETQQRMNEYEGRFNPPNTMANTLGDTSNYTPAQLAVKASWDRLQAAKDKYSAWFSEQESKLPEDQFFEPTPEQRAPFDAEIERLTAIHDVNFAKLENKTQTTPRLDTIEGTVLRSEAKDPNTAVPEPPKPTMATAPMGQTIIIRKEGATPTVIKQAKEAGFEFEGLNDQGNFRFKKTRQPEAQPILESEIGEARPTPSGVKEHLGPLTDVKKINPIAEGMNFSRSVMAAVDFSGPLRQGIALIHKPDFWRALKPMFKAWASEDAFRASQDAIAQRPLFRERAGPNGKILPSFADDAGLKLTDLTDLTKREEAVMSSWAEKVPGVRRSGRAYVAFLNNLRADVFESLVKDGKIFGADAKVNLPLAREIANFVNTASGRGSLGKLEQSAVALNTLFFAPRLIAARVQMLNPAYYIMANPMVRKEALKSLFAIAAAGNTVTQLGKMAGGTVSMDPASSDFGKLKIGNTRIDPYGGFQQYIVAANRLLNPIPGMGQKVTSSTSGNEYDLWNPEGPFDPTHATVAGRFLRGKMHPVLGFAWSLLTGKKEMSGEEMNFSTLNPMENAVAQRFIPILMQDLYELSQDSDMPPSLKALVATMSTFGMGSQTYD